MKCLVPRMRQPSPSRIARVRMARTSEPGLRLGHRQAFDALTPDAREQVALPLARESRPARCSTDVPQQCSAGRSWSLPSSFSNSTRVTASRPAPPTSSGMLAAYNPAASALSRICAPAPGVGRRSARPPARVGRARVRRRPESPRRRSAARQSSRSRTQAPPDRGGCVRIIAPSGSSGEDRGSIGWRVGHGAEGHHRGAAREAALTQGHHRRVEGDRRPHDVRRDTRPGAVRPHSQRRRGGRRLR